MKRKSAGVVDHQDWKLLPDTKEKYAAYLCSREWNVKKEAVHKRAEGLCERCGGFPIDAVHHLTYERKYREELEDLQGWCKPCHDFTHGKSDFDPVHHRVTAMYLRACKKCGVTPYPYQLHGGLAEPKTGLRLVMAAIDQLEIMRSIAVEYDREVGGYAAIKKAIDDLNCSLPFDYVHYKRRPQITATDVQTYDRLVKYCGCSVVSDEVLCGPSDE